MGEVSLGMLRDELLKLLPVPRVVAYLFARGTYGNQPAKGFELVTPLIESGRIFLPQRARWIDDFLHEMSVFPSSLYSDQVDALSQAFLYLKSANWFDLVAAKISNWPS